MAIEGWHDGTYDDGTVLCLDVGSLQEATHMTKLQRTHMHTHTSAYKTSEI